MYEVSLHISFNQLQNKIKHPHVNWQRIVNSRFIIPRNRNSKITTVLSILLMVKRDVKEIICIEHVDEGH